MPQGFPVGIKKQDGTMKPGGLFLYDVTSYSKHIGERCAAANHFQHRFIYCRQNIGELRGDESRLFIFLHGFSLNAIGDSPSILGVPRWRANIRGVPSAKEAPPERARFSASVDSEFTSLLVAKTVINRRVLGNNFAREF